MRTITIKSKDGHSTFKLIPYRAGETVRVFKGATGVFGKESGSKTAGIVYVTEGAHGINAEDRDVDDKTIWDWIQHWMQIGMTHGEPESKADLPPLALKLDQVVSVDIEPGQNKLIVGLKDGNSMTFTRRANGWRVVVDVSFNSVCVIHNVEWQEVSRIQEIWNALTEWAFDHECSIRDALRADCVKGAKSIMPDLFTK